MLSQGRRFVRKMVKMSSGCWTSVITVDGPIEIRKQIALEEEEKPQPEPRERTLSVSKFAEGRGLIEGEVEVLEDIEW